MADSSRCSSRFLDALPVRRFGNRRWACFRLIAPTIDTTYQLLLHPIVPRNSVGVGGWDVPTSSSLSLVPTPRTFELLSVRSSQPPIWSAHLRESAIKPARAPVLDYQFLPRSDQRVLFGYLLPVRLPFGIAIPRTGAMQRMLFLAFSRSPCYHTSCICS